MKTVKLLTKEVLNRLPKLYSTEKVPLADKVLVAKFFGGGRGTWYAVEFDGEDTFFGYVVSPLGPDCDEWGNFNLSELQSVRFPPFGLPMERDMYFKPKTFKEEFPDQG